MNMIHRYRGRALRDRRWLRRDFETDTRFLGQLVFMLACALVWMVWLVLTAPVVP